MASMETKSDDTANAFLRSVHSRASLAPRTILFPESDDPRTIEAVTRLVSHGGIRPVLVSRHTSSPVVDAPCPVLYTDDAGLHTAVTTLLLERRASRGLGIEAAREHARDPLMFADGLVALGHADGCVAGATHTTADVLRAALWTIGTAKGVRTVSSAFYMLVPPFRGVSGEVLTFTDCAVIPEPTARQLAEIAIAAGRDRTRIVGDVPIVAMLSYSTIGSAEGLSIDRVREALRIVREEAPDLQIDGEFQGDAALIEAVGLRKAPSHPLAGRANVLVFPSLDAGNIAYKLVQRLAGAGAIGPILQGLRAPCSDLSRGATVDDIVHVAAITALQATEAA